MSIVFLDLASLDNSDLDLTPLSQFNLPTKFYPTTSPEQVAERVTDAEIVISNKVYLGEQALKNAHQLKLICIAATGTNNVDLEYVCKRQIPVCNTRGYGTAAVSQHTLMLMLALSSHFLPYQSLVKNGAWQKSPFFCLMDYPVVELNGKTLGIIGYGELGKSVARLAEAFGMTVLVADVQNDKPRPGRLTLDELLPQVDYLSLHCPLTASTNNLITLKQFRAMKRSAFLINTARGGIVNEADLLTALNDKLIAGAATDVLSVEPPQAGNILLEADLPNLIITPHNAWVSLESRQNLLNQLAANIHGFLAGTCKNIVTK